MGEKFTSRPAGKDNIFMIMSVSELMHKTEVRHTRGRMWVRESLLD